MVDLGNLLALALGIITIFLPFMIYLLENKKQNFSLLYDQVVYDKILNMKWLLLCSLLLLISPFIIVLPYMFLKFTGYTIFTTSAFVISKSLYRTYKWVRNTWADPFDFRTSYHNKKYIAYLQGIDAIKNIEKVRIWREIASRSKDLYYSKRYLFFELLLQDYERLNTTKRMKQNEKHLRHIKAQYVNHIEVIYINALAMDNTCLLYTSDAADE